MSDDQHDRFQVIARERFWEEKATVEEGCLRSTSDFYQGPTVLIGCVGLFGGTGLAVYCSVLC